MTKSFVLVLLGTILLLGLQTGCANAPIAAENGAAKPNTPNSAQSQFPELKVGMTAEEIRAKLGNPIEIRPMESTAGKAEVWVFHIERTVNTTQVATSTKDVPAFSLNTTDTLTTVPEMVYSMADKKAVTILSLLMINGHLIAQTSATGERIEIK